MDPDTPTEVIARAVEAFGGLDILVNNAGGPPPGTKLPQFGFLDLTDDAGERCPGPVRTPWWPDEGGAADIIAAHAGADRESMLITVAPEMMQLTTGRLAEPQEIADAVVLLASPRSGSTTGTEFVVDSGWRKSI